MAAVDYREYPPHPALVPFVRTYWSLCGRAPDVKALDWMIGCWTTRGGERTSWESWTKASDDVMLGMSYSRRAAVMLGPCLRCNRMSSAW